MSDRKSSDEDRAGVKARRFDETFVETQRRVEKRKLIAMAARKGRNKLCIVT